MPTTLPNIPSQYRWRVKHRLRVLAYANAHSLKAASRHFGVERKTIRRWRGRYRAHGVLGLVPRYPTQRPSRLPADTLRLIEHARRELEYGAGRAQVWLWRMHRIRLHRTTLTRSFAGWGCRICPAGASALRDRASSGSSRSRNRVIRSRSM